MVLKEVKVGSILDYGEGERCVVIDLPSEQVKNRAYVGAEFMALKDGRVGLHMSNTNFFAGVEKVVEEIMSPDDIFALLALGSHNRIQWVPTLAELEEAAKLPGIVIEFDDI